MAKRNNHLFGENAYLIVISLLAFLTCLTLFALRHLDDNRLTSWQWAFQNVDASFVFLMLSGGIVASFGVLKISLPRKSFPLFLFLISFASAMIFWSEPEVIVDASRYFTQAKHLEIYGIRYFIEQWGRDINAWTDLPLVPFIYGMIFRFAGENRIYIQIFTTLLFSLSTVLTYMTGKALWNEEVGFWGGMLLLGIPYMFTQVPLMLVDVAVMFFIMLSIYTFIKAMERGGTVPVMLASTAISLAFFSKYSAWLMLSVLVVVLITYRNPETEVRKVKYFYRASVIALISCIIAGLVFIYKNEVFLAQINLLMNYQRPGLGRWGESFISTFFFQVHPFITAAALYSVFSAISKKDVRYLSIIWLVALVFILDIRRIRYVIMVFPMLALMASYGLQEAGTRNVRKFFVSIIVIMSFVVAVFAYLPLMKQISTVNLQKAGMYLDSIDEPFVEVFTVSSDDRVANPSVSVPILDLFTRKNIFYAYDNGKYKKDRNRIKTSPLRFTWAYKNPGYYAGEVRERKDTAVAVIADNFKRELPEAILRRLGDYSLAEKFETFDGIFQFQTFVRVYRKQD